jgi:PIN domain nuclease of toxin-antitoxin system
VRVLLDTHSLLWFAYGNPKMSNLARQTIASRDNEVFVSAASAWELTTKFRLGKLPAASKWAAEFRARLRSLGFQELAVTVEHGQRAGLLPGNHKDPFDRMLIAQAQAENLPIVSNEKIFDDYLLLRIW